MSKGLIAFVSIPIYTTLLSAEDFGIISIFWGLVNISACIMSFSADRSISRYYFDQKDEIDFKEFVGTSTALAIIFFLINSILLLLFADDFGKLVGLKKNVVYLLLPISAINIIGLAHQQIYGPLLRSKEIAVTSIINVFLGFILSIGLISMVKSEKFYGQIYGQIFSGLIVLIMWIRQIKPFFRWTFNPAYLKYIFLYSIPLIPYALSNVIIEQISKIFIGNYQSLSQAGFYSIALTVSSIVNLIIGVTHQAWNPYYFEYMNSRNYKQIDIDFIKILKITILFAFSVACFGKEIGLILAKNEFSKSLYLIPFFTVGYVFYQWSYIYLRNFGYSKSTHYMTITVLISGISNVFLNYFLVKLYGELGAALSFMFSYIIMTFVGWLINKYIVKLHATSIKSFLSALLIFALFYFLLFTVFRIKYFFIEFIIKGLLIGILSIFIFWNERNQLILIGRNKFTKLSEKFEDNGK